MEFSEKTCYETTEKRQKKSNYKSNHSFFLVWRIAISCAVLASSDIKIRLPLPLIKADIRNYCQGRPGYALPHHLKKDQLRECCASQSPLRQSDLAGAIQSPGEEKSIDTDDYSNSPKRLNHSGRGVALD